VIRRCPLNRAAEGAGVSVTDSLQGGGKAHAGMLATRTVQQPGARGSSKVAPRATGGSGVASGSGDPDGGDGGDDGSDNGGDQPPQFASPSFRTATLRSALETVRRQQQWRARWQRA